MQTLELYAIIYAIHYDGLKVLTLQNETGVLATNKPFDPFTAYPTLGKSMYLGSAEVFNKPLGEMAINIKKTQESSSGHSSSSATSTQSGEEYSLSFLQQRSFQLAMQSNWKPIFPKKICLVIFYKNRVHVTSGDFTLT